MNKFGLDKKYIDFVRSVICKYLDNADIYIFGSRAKNEYKEYSDIDIVIDGGAPLDKEKLLNINIELTESNIPYKVDVIDFFDITESFKNFIKDDMKPFIY